MPIPFFRPELPDLDAYVEQLRGIWSSRMLSNFAEHSQGLEALASDELGVDHVLAVSSGDAGLMLLLRALDLAAGSPCFVADFTFQSTVNAPVWAGLRPVLVDVDPHTFCMDPGALAEAVARHPGPGVVLPTHTFGNPCDVEALEAVAASAGLRLVFDAAHAYGSRRAGASSGALGEAAVFSLSATKLVTSAEGGLIATDDADLADRLRYLRGYGFQHDYRSVAIGMNGKMSELHAALGELTLARIGDAVARRQEIVARYRSGLGDAVGWQVVAPADVCTYKDVSVVVGSEAPEVGEAMAAAGIATKRYFVPLHEQRPYAAFADGPLPVSRRLHETSLCLPAFGELTDEQIDRVCSCLLTSVSTERP